MNVMGWEAPQRRMSSFVVFGVALALAIAGVAIWFFWIAAPAWLYWAILGALVLVLAFMVLLIVLTPRGASAEAHADETHASAAPAPMASEAEAAPATPAEPRVLTLRCGDCGTIFDVTDTGERPLYHTCPGCGAEGALRDEPAMEAAPEAAPAPAEAYAPPQEAAPESAYAPAAPPPPMKKIKLRCGGCKEVFSIEDSGERPLRRACPHCGRMGQIN